MSTIKITRMEDVRVGDHVTLTRDGLTVSGRVRPEGTAVGFAQWCVYFPGIGTLYSKDGWTLVSATREVPEVTPGTCGTGMVYGQCAVRLMRVLPGETHLTSDGRPAEWAGAIRHYTDADVTDFAPDDAEALRAELVETHEAYREWKKSGKAMHTALLDIWHMVTSWDTKHLTYGENPETVFQSVKAEVERLRAARQAPTREQIAEALWPDAPEGARAGLAHSDMSDRVVDLFEQGGAS